MFCTATERSLKQSFKLSISTAASFKKICQFIKLNVKKLKIIYNIQTKICFHKFIGAKIKTFWRIVL